MKIKDLEFRLLLTSEKIQARMKELAEEINRDYAGKTPMFLPVLNGSFMFAADLIRELEISCRVSFVKLSSYQGTQSSGQVRTIIGHEESLFNQDILIVEDIIDSGQTLEKILGELRGLGAKSVEAVALLRKKPARDKNADVRYVGFDLEEEFVLGYGLDYDGLGRQYKDLYEQVS